MANPFDQSAAISAASSGLGHRCVGIGSLTTFIAALDPKEGWIDIVEAFEIDGEMEVPRIDLSMYGDHDCYDLPPHERRRLAADRLQFMLASVSLESSDFIFEIWLDQDN